MIIKTKARRFTDPDILSTVRRESLIQWLTPAEEYLTQRGVLARGRASDEADDGFGQDRATQRGDRGEGNAEKLKSFRTGNADTSPPAPLPSAERVAPHAPGKGWSIDFAKLASVFMEPDDAMPAYLVESMFLIQEMASDEAMDALISARIENRLSAPASDDYTPVDVAVQTYLDAPALLEQVHNEQQIGRVRLFEYFQASRGTSAESREPEAFGEAPNATARAAVLPAAVQLRALEAHLNEWFVARNRGGNCRVFLHPRGEEWSFLVRHGMPSKREGAIGDDGEDTCVFYRPRKHDVAVFNTVTGELKMHCCDKRELEEFRRAFGLHLFGDEEFFPRAVKYRFDPLVNDGRDCLRCSDIDGLDRVTLRDVLFDFPVNRYRSTHCGDDVFDVIQKGLIHWPSVWCIKRATFEVKFTGSRKTRRVTLLAPNRALYARDEDGALIEQWLKARGFTATTPDEDEADDLFTLAVA